MKTDAILINLLTLPPLPCLPSSLDDVTESVQLCMVWTCPTMALSVQRWICQPVLDVCTVWWHSPGRHPRHRGGLSQNIWGWGVLARPVHIVVLCNLQSTECVNLTVSRLTGFRTIFIFFKYCLILIEIHRFQSRFLSVIFFKLWSKRLELFLAILWRGLLLGINSFIPVSNTCLKYSHVIYRIAHFHGIIPINI